MAPRPELLDVPLVTFSSVTRRSVDEWTDMGWSVVLDPFTAQVLAHLTVRDAYQRALAGVEPLDRSPADIMAGYRELPDAAGLEELYDIERRTTEPGT